MRYFTACARRARCRDRIDHDKVFDFQIACAACTTDENELNRMIKKIRGEDGVLWVDLVSIVTRKKVLSTKIEDKKKEL